MEFKKEDLDLIENMAKLRLNPSEKERCYNAFVNAFKMSEKMLAVDTEDVEPMISPLDLVNVMREDEVLPSLERDRAMALSAETEDGCFKVPRIL